MTRWFPDGMAVKGFNVPRRAVINWYPNLVRIRGRFGTRTLALHDGGEELDKHERFEMG